MGDISLPQDQDYYRVSYENPEYFPGCMYYNRLTAEEMIERVFQLESVPSNTTIKVEHVEVFVRITDINLEDL